MILSIDVGINNLSYCLANNSQITLWDTIDIRNTKLLDNNMIKQTPKIQAEQQKYICSCSNISKITKKNTGETIKECKNIATYVKGDFYVCKKHVNDTNVCKFIVPFLSDKQIKDLKKLNVLQLTEIIHNNKIDCSNIVKNTKINLINTINEFIKDKCLEVLKDKNKINLLQSKKEKPDMLLYILNLNKYFDYLFTQHVDNIKYIIIENQITSKMRILSFVIAQYFINKIPSASVKMISPCYKLKNLEKETTDYSTRKKNSIKHCLNYLKEHNYNNWINIFESNAKQDDMSDSFLQLLWFLENKY